jgi:hypothetical protein
VPTRVLSGGVGDLPDWDAVYRDQIHPKFAVPEGGHDLPRCLFVVGPQGSGKTTRIKRLRDELGRRVTQCIVPDELMSSIDTLHSDAPVAKDAFEAYRSIHCADHCQRLADHAVSLRAHILWERAIPGNVERLALALRRLGYRVECLVLATPVEVGWLDTAIRSLNALAAGDRSSLRIGWAIAAETALRWPAVIDRMERNLTVDRIAVLDRDGDVCFENSVQGPPDQRQWTNSPFAFESLMVERAGPRTGSMLDALLSTWNATSPQLAAANHPAWPDTELASFDAQIRALVADPASRFDLNAPDPDPVAAKAWIARLTADLAAVQAGPEAKGQDLTRRTRQLLTLVSQLGGQPTR